MYLIQYVNAFLACEHLMEKELDFKTAHALVMLRQKLKLHVDFFAAEEGKLAKEFARLDSDGKIELSDGGRFFLREGADEESHRKKRQELCMLEVEDISPMHAGKIGEVRPSVLEALVGFLEFETEG